MFSFMSSSTSKRSREPEQPIDSINTNHSKKVNTNNNDDNNNNQQYYNTHVMNLNTSLVKWFSNEVNKNPDGNYTVGIEDAISYSKNIQNKFGNSFKSKSKSDNPKHGNLLTWGCGDCGQTGHGLDEQDDLTTPYPRLVDRIYNKISVISISCGGIHNAITSDEGCVYTWG